MVSVLSVAMVFYCQENGNSVTYGSRQCSESTPKLTPDHFKTLYTPFCILGILALRVNCSQKIVLDVAIVLFKLSEQYSSIIDFHHFMHQPNIKQTTYHFKTLCVAAERYTM